MYKFFHFKKVCFQVLVICCLKATAAPYVTCNIWCSVSVDLLQFKLVNDTYIPMLIEYQSNLLKLIFFSFLSIFKNIFRISDKLVNHFNYHLKPYFINWFYYFYLNVKIADFEILYRTYIRKYLLIHFLY